MKLLLIEDDPSQAKVLEIALTQQGYEVSCFSNGISGFQSACRNEYGVIVLDLTLPLMDGIEVCQLLRKRGQTLPIMMLTGRDTSDARVVGLDTGADDYLTKPFELEELYARLRALIRRGGNVSTVSSRLKIDDLILDRDKHAVIRETRHIHLMPKEYELLEYLLVNKDKALSREDILTNVWGIEDGYSSNRLDVYVKHLRRKIEREGEKKLIHTVRGVGYRLSLTE